MKPKVHADVALVHEWFDVWAGSENVLAEIHEVFPASDVWGLWNRPPGRDDMPFEVYETWLARTPMAGHKGLSLPFMPLVWRTLPKIPYEAVITNSSSFAHTANFHCRDTAYFQYVHTPPRYLWTPELDGRGSSKAAAPARGFLKWVDRRGARLHTKIAVNSHEVASRVERFWNKSATVINPPVDTTFFQDPTASSEVPFDGQYLLGMSRWIEYKRLDLVIKLGDELGIPVVIAGSGPLEDELRALAATCSVPVHFEVKPPGDRLRDLYRGAIATVFPPYEDFGIVPIESAATGTRVIALNSGGSKETVVDGVTGALAADQSVAAFAEAFHRLPGDNVTVQLEHANKFSRAEFRRKFADWCIW
ncbi:MAG: glycosyltransferase [Candidatus Nanopelagicales bacterium]